MIVLGLLCIAALVLFRAVMTRQQLALLVAVALYGAIAAYVAVIAPELMVLTIAMAAAVVVVGLLHYLFVRLTGAARG